jgi:hypothetical protein
MLEGVFHLYKLHGSVNWSRSGDGEIEVVPKPTPESACLIYPAKGKYQQSYVQPHLELVSQYFSVLREPNTCLIVTGFGFNDDHLSEPSRESVRASLRSLTSFFNFDTSGGICGNTAVSNGPQGSALHSANPHRSS